MMRYKFSRRSLDNLVGVHPDLVRVVHDLMNMQIMDFTVVEGLRTPERQRELFAQGKSKTLNSKHLKQPDGFSHAVDIYPHPIDMGAVRAGNAREISRFGLLVGMALALAKSEGIKIRSGMDWDGDGETLDHTFFDAPHLELITTGD